MKRRIAALVCLLLFFAPAARAERDIGALARLAEADGRVLGMEVYRKTNLAWGSLPLVDAAANKALEGLCNALRIDTRAQGAWDAGYVSLDVMLQNTSVFDFTLMTRDGVYYEQSNLLGGATVGATKEEFADFVARLSAKSGGAMPQNMDILFDFVRLGLGGGDVNVDMDTINAALAAIDGWSKTALVKTEKLRPVSYMPGAYCARAEVIQITRDEALALTAALADVIGGDEALLMGAAAEQVYQGDETALREAVAKAKETLETLPGALGEALPESLAPAEYRELFG